MPPPSPPVPVPRYGGGALADVVPALLAALGVGWHAEHGDRLGLPPLRRVCLLLVDGLGAQLLRRHPDRAPYLCDLLERGRVLTAGFPSTTATSLASIGTGRPPGEHGLVGYLLGVPGHDRVVNTLQWRLHGPGPRVDLLKELVPEEVQPDETAFEQAVADGVAVTRLGPPHTDGSGLTRAVLRGGRFDGAYSLGDLTAAAAAALRGSDRALVYAYHGDLDLTGHVRGPESEAWALHLAHVDQLAQAIACRLPSDAALVITADHGMVEVGERIDLDAAPDLLAGVRLVGGEPRARHVYTRPGAADDVLAAWTAALGGSCWVVSREQAIADGWFGPRVLDRVRPRIGDVVAASYDASALVRRSAEPNQSALLGHHGSMTADEQLVPLLVTTG